MRVFTGAFLVLLCVPLANQEMAAALKFQRPGGEP